MLDGVKAAGVEEYASLPYSPPSSAYSSRPGPHASLLKNWYGGRDSSRRRRRLHHVATRTRITQPCSRISNAGRSSLAGEADGEILVVRVTRPRVFKPISLESTFFVFPLSSARAAFSVETLARLDERRVIDEGVASVPLPPVSNPASPPPLPTPRACCNRCDGLLFWWRRRPSLAWCWRRSLLLPCACHSRMNDLRLLLATTMRSRYASRALTRAPIPAQEYGWAC